MPDEVIIVDSKEYIRQTKTVDADVDALRNEYDANEKRIAIWKARNAEIKALLDSVNLPVVKPIEIEPKPIEEEKL